MGVDLKDGVSTNRTRLVSGMEKPYLSRPLQTMTRRPFPMRHVSRPNDCFVVTPPGRPSEPPHTMPCRLQDPTWEDLLGQR